MDIEIQEVSSQVTVLDLRALKAEILAEVLQRTAEDARLNARQDADRQIRPRASDRPDEVA
jgi:hypothetical protein